MPTRQARYVGWLTRRSRWIAAGAALAVGLATYLTVFRLPLYADFSYLLPADAPSVRDAERLAQRMPAQDTMLMMIVAPDPASREAAGTRAIAAVAALVPDLVQRVETDDTELKAFITEHRHLFIPVDDLHRARVALEDETAKAKLRANPMYIDLDDETTADPHRLDELRAKERAAQAVLDKQTHVGIGGHTQVLVIRTAFRGTDVDRDVRLMKRLDRVASEIHRDYPSVTVGFAGGPAVTVAEHDALTRGMLLSSLITMALVALVLLIHLRSVRMLLLLSVNIVIATVISFGVAALTVGHLNAATAFLGAIIAGNGVNYGILLVARYLEERRALSRHDAAARQAALATAIAGTLRPTLVASLGAAIAYGALAATSFRGFADFALIGGLGMLVCWICSFVLLPLAILRFVRAERPTREPGTLFGRAVVGVFGFRRPGLVLAVTGAVSIGAIVVTTHYFADDPYEYDLTQLRSEASSAMSTRAWLKLSDVTFGRGLAGLAGQTFIAVDRADQVPAVVDALHDLSKREPIVGPTRSVIDVVPRDQEAKLAELARIRDLLDAADDPELAKLRPPADLSPITTTDLPAGLKAQLTERDGRIGYIIAVKPGANFDERNGRDLIAFADAVRQVRLANGETVSTAGASVMFADVLVQIQEDGPLITGIAAIGLVVMVLLVVGRSRRSYAVLAASAAGSIGMVAVCAVAGLKVNFLDFVALPITLGLGIDYAINVADRAAEADPIVALRSTGGTVLVCSLTTMIGYASLLISDNLAIRGFGLASLIGEVTCVVAAFVIVPAMIAVRPFAVRRVYADAASSIHGV